jgi:lysophospholipase L1-like esterase
MLAAATMWAQAPEPVVAQDELHTFLGQILIRGKEDGTRQDILFVVHEPRVWIWLGTMDKPLMSADFAALAGREAELQARGQLNTDATGKASFKGTAWLSLRGVGDAEGTPSPSGGAAEAATAHPATADTAAAPRPNQETTIPRHLQGKFDAFDAADQASPPPKGMILLVGSSSLEIWGKQGAARDLAPHPVVSRAIGGTTTRFQVDHFDRLTGKYAPAVIVYYAGDNDIGKNPKAKPEPLAKNFAAYVDLVKAHLPETKIVYVTIKPSIQRWETWPTMDKANQLIRNLCEQDPDRLTYLDIGPTVLGPDGKPDPAMFQQDGLHIKAECYRKWAKELKPVLDKLCGKGK